MITKEQEQTLKELIIKAEGEQLKKILDEIGTETEEEEYQQKEIEMREYFKISQELSIKLKWLLKEVFEQEKTTKKAIARYGIEESPDSYKAFILGQKLHNRK